MTIIHVITNFSAAAGAETMLARLLQVSQAPRILVVPLMEVSERNAAMLDNPRVRIHPLGIRNAAGMAGAVGRLARLMREEQAAATMCWMYHAMVVGSLARTLSRTGCPLYWNVRQSIDDPDALTRSTRLALKLCRSLSGWPDAIVFNSQRGLEQHREYGFRNTENLLIPNGFVLPTSPAPPRESLRVFGIAARFHPQKDYPTFFHAAGTLFKTRPDVRFIAVGKGLSPDNDKLAPIIAAAGLPFEVIELRGETRDMDQFYSDIDGLVLSSRSEGFPNVVAEAMSYGRPVVTTDVGEAARIVGDAGIVVPSRRPNDLAEGMRRLMALGPEEYDRMCVAARDRIEWNYALPGIARRYDALLMPPAPEA